jgi:hypothetical protein
MKITLPKLFYFSLTSLIITGLIAAEFHETIAVVATRDFNFGEPLVYGLLIIQACVAIAGMAASVKTEK